MKKLNFAATVIVLTLFASVCYSQSVAIYPVKIEGFKLNESEVTELHRVAMQSCYDAGLTCSGRGSTSAAVQREQQFSGGGGQIVSAPYVAECALTGKTEERFNVGTKSGGFPLTVGGFKNVGGVTVGGITGTRTSGVRVGGGGMNLACQFSRTSDGILVYSESNEKMGLSGELVLVEGRSSNVKKLQKAFTKMFEHAKSRLP